MSQTHDPFTLIIASDTQLGNVQFKDGDPDLKIRNGNQDITKDPDKKIYKILRIVWAQSQTMRRILWANTLTS